MKILSMLFGDKENKSPPSNPTKEYFHSFQGGDKVLFLGREATVTRRDPEWVWYTDHLVSELTVGWWDGGVFREKVLSPSEVMACIKKVA